MRVFRLCVLVSSFLGVVLCQNAHKRGNTPNSGSDIPALGYNLTPEWPIQAKNAAGTPAGPWNFIQVAAVAIDRRGHVLVLHRGAHPIMEF